MDHRYFYEGPVLEFDNEKPEVIWLISLSERQIEHREPKSQYQENLRLLIRR